MKKIYLLSLAALSSVTMLNAQSSLVLTKNSDNSIVANGSTVYATTTPGNDIDTDITFKNTSSLYNTYRLKRYDLLLNSASSSDYASAYFCTGVTCYSPSQTLSGNVDLDVNASEVARLHLQEATTVGSSNVRYLLYNVNDPTDTVSFYVSYNNSAAGVHSYSKALSKASDVYPNPSSVKAQISFISNGLVDNTEVTVINSLGVVMSKKEVEIIEGKNNINIDVENLSSGIYFVQLLNGNSKIVKKFTVNK